MNRLAIAAAGALALLAAAPAAAKNDRPVECVFKNTLRVQRAVMASLVKNGFDAKTSDEKMAHGMIGTAIAACVAQYGWGDKRQAIAVRFMSGRVLREDAAYHGRPVGLTAEMIAGYVAGLDAAARAAYTSGQATSAHNQAAFAYLKAQGMAVDAMAPDDIRRIGELMNEGVAGTIMEQDADAAYAH